MPAVDSGIAGRVVIVTGAGHGIGRGVALAFAEEGAHVALLGRTPERLAETERLLTERGYRSLALPCDVRSASEVDAAVARVLDAHGRIDVLINNAGVFVWRPFVALTEEDWDRTLDTNLKGCFLCAKAVVPAMSQRKWGRIVNVSSIHGRVGDKNVAAHCAAKFGLIGLTQSLARELREHNITVNAVLPGAVDNKDEAVTAEPPAAPLVAKLVPRQVARLCVFLASDDAASITGASIDQLGGTDLAVISTK
ncbi:MAG: SDR family NAD(P)-dependent oxidoreductase [Planctomycetota bacterium]